MNPLIPTSNMNQNQQLIVPAKAQLIHALRKERKFLPKLRFVFDDPCTRKTSALGRFIKCQGSAIIRRESETLSDLVQ